MFRHVFHRVFITLAAASYVNAASCAIATSLFIIAASGAAVALSRLRASYLPCANQVLPGYKTKDYTLQRYGWKHPRAAAVRKLWKEKATEAVLELLENTPVGR